MTQEQLSIVAQDFAQAMRQWRMYWDMDEPVDIQISNIAEAVWYRNCEKTLKELQENVRI